MGSQVFLCVVLFIISKTAVGQKLVLNHERHQDRLAAADYQSKEPHMQQWITQPLSSLGCPQQCTCKMNDTHHIVSVDCSSRGLTMVPDLPETTVELSLWNNSISKITCESFKRLRSLKHLNLAVNKIKDNVHSCAFHSQSSSLLHINMSENSIHNLDVKLFKGLFYLETLDLSLNYIVSLNSSTLAGLARLTYLNLSFNLIANIEKDAFKGLHYLRELSLENNRLDDHTSFDKDVFQDLGALITLNTKANAGHYLSDAISSLKNLSYLYMNYQLGELGTGFQQLINLQVLHVSVVWYRKSDRYKPHSECGVVEATSNLFKNIRTKKDFELYMSDCGIRVIENNTFLPLTTLVTLDLSRNLEINLGEEGQTWMKSLINTAITSFNLSGTWNFINHHFLLKWTFSDLAKTNLKILTLRNNKIYNIDPTPHFPATIEKLDVSANSMPLNWLYSSFLAPDLPDFKLKELNANDQQIEVVTNQISQEIPGTNNVRQITSSDTHHKISDGTANTFVPPELSDNDLLNDSQILDISVNKTANSHHVDMYKTEFGNVWNANSRCPKYLKGQNSNITIICLPAYLEAIYARKALIPVPKSVPHIYILNNTVLRYVDLTDNLLTRWLGPIENVQSLNFLDLSRNHCKDLDVNFFKYMVSLETLIMKENLIGLSLDFDVDGITFSTLSNLKVLDVSQNAIRDLSTKAFIHNLNLENLDLSDNQLSGFQPTIATISNMSFMDLSGNLLPGLSDQTCEELKVLKSKKENFTINLLGNRLLFTCDYLSFLDLVISRPDIFFKVEHLQFRYVNGTKLSYKDLAQHFPLLAKVCQVQRLFDVLLIAFFIVVGTVVICAVIYHKRWKLRYLYYIGHRRMHIGEQIVDYAPVADVFMTYDQDDVRWRRFMQQTFLPGLNQRNITYILGETDFPGGDLMAHVTGAVVGTKKTVVLLSSDIFDDHHREFEMNLAIMREMDTRSLKLVPIFVEETDLALYPREIGLFLHNQWHRCLSYNDSEDFWDSFVGAVREDN